MAHHYTGRDGSLYVDGTKVAKVTDWRLQGQQATLETTTLGDFASTYINGNLSYSGSCTVLAYETDANVLEGLTLIDKVMRSSINDPEDKPELDLRMDNGSKLRRFRFKACVDSIDTGSSAGGLQEFGVNFTVDGPLTTVVL